MDKLKALLAKIPKKQLLICLALVVGFMLAISIAKAGTGTVSWTPATTCEDGTTIPPSAFGPVTVEYGNCSGVNTFGTVLGTVAAASVTATSVTVNSPLLAEGSYYAFRAYTNLVVPACGPGQLKSVASTVGCKTIPIADHGGPKPPVLTTVVVTAYVIKGTPRHPYMAAVGRVPLGTACGTRWVKAPAYATIPASAVTGLPRKAKGQTLYGQCA